MDPGSYGFLDFGAAAIGPVDSSFFSSYLESGFCAGMDYLRRNLDKRLNPSQLVEGACSVLCFLAPYGGQENGVAGFACGIDYHIVVKNRLFDVMKDLSVEFPFFKGRAFVDSAPILERYWAVKAGLGFIGNNGLLISPDWGLRCVIGIIICNITADKFARHKPLSVSSCGDCGRCRKACPSGALCERGLVDARRCISYRTIEEKETDNRNKINFRGWVFGCEECLAVCPWNKSVQGWPEFETNRSFLRDVKWDEVTDKEFESRFHDSGLKRAGLEKLKNNAHGN